MSENSLKKELETYEANKERLVAESEGRYVVIAGDEVLNVWETYEDALQAGYLKCGLKPFLVKKIESTENVHYFTRDILQCRS